MRGEGRYTAIARRLEGVHVTGYIVKDNCTGTEELLDKSIVERLALHKAVSNMTAQIYDDRIILKGFKCKLNQLPTCDEDGNISQIDNIRAESNEDMIITARIMDNKSVIGYMVSLIRNGKQIKEKALDRGIVLKLAQGGYITNARTQLACGNTVLRGVNCELSQLPIMKKAKKPVYT